MATHSSTFAWNIPWMEEPGRLQSMWSWRVRHDWAASLSLLTFMHWRRKWQPTPVFLPGESQGRGSLVAAVYGVAQSRTWLKRLSSSSSSILGSSWKSFQRGFRWREVEWTHFYTPASDSTLMHFIALLHSCSCSLYFILCFLLRLAPSQIKCQHFNPSLKLCF